MSKQLIVLWGTIYIVLAIPVAMLAGRLICRAALRSVPAIWVQPGHQLFCHVCGGTVDVRGQEDGIWLSCADCGSMLPADQYQRLLEHRLPSADFHAPAGSITLLDE